MDEQNSKIETVPFRHIMMGTHRNEYKTLEVYSRSNDWLLELNLMILIENSSTRVELN